MKLNNALRLTLLMLLVFHACSSMNTNLRPGRNNGFRVLMDSEFINHINNFVDAILTRARIKEKASPLFTCVLEMIRTLNTLAGVTQDAAQTLKSLSTLGLYGVFNTFSSIGKIFRTTQEENKCKDVGPSLRKYLASMENEARPNFFRINKLNSEANIRRESLPNGTYTISEIPIRNKDYIDTFLKTLKLSTTVIYYKVKQSAILYSKRKYRESGDIIGDLLYGALKLEDFNEDKFDWKTFETLIGNINKEKEKHEAEKFGKRFETCVESLALILHDIRLYYKESENKLGSNRIGKTDANAPTFTAKKRDDASNETSSNDSNNTNDSQSPDLEDLFKYMFEVHKVLNCFNGVAETLKDIAKSN